jgi:hypothetical protein
MTLALIYRPGRPMAGRNPRPIDDPWVPAGAKARKGIVFEPASRQNLDPVARDTLLTAIARTQCWIELVSREQGIITAQSGLGHNAAVLLGSGSTRPSRGF